MRNVRCLTLARRPKQRTNVDTLNYVIRLIITARILSSIAATIRVCVQFLGRGDRVVQHLVKFCARIQFFLVVATIFNVVVFVIV